MREATKKKEPSEPQNMKVNLICQFHDRHRGSWRRRRDEKEKVKKRQRRRRRGWRSTNVTVRMDDSPRNDQQIPASDKEIRGKSTTFHVKIN